MTRQRPLESELPVPYFLFIDLVKREQRTPWRLTLQEEILSSDSFSHLPPPSFFTKHRHTHHTHTQTNQPGKQQIKIN